MEEKKFCPRCGMEVVDPSADKCYVCGAPLKEPEAPMAPSDMSDFTNMFMTAMSAALANTTELGNNSTQQEQTPIHQIAKPVLLNDMPSDNESEFVEGYDTESFPEEPTFEPPAEESDMSEPDTYSHVETPMVPVSDVPVMAAEPVPQAPVSEIKRPETAETEQVSPPVLTETPTPNTAGDHVEQVPKEAKPVTESLFGDMWAQPLPPMNDNILSGEIIQEDEPEENYAQEPVSSGILETQEGPSVSTVQTHYEEVLEMTEPAGRDNMDTPAPAIPEHGSVEEQDLAEDPGIVQPAPWTAPPSPTAASDPEPVAESDAAPEAQEPVTEPDVPTSVSEDKKEKGQKTDKAGNKKGLFGFGGKKKEKKTKKSGKKKTDTEPVEKPKTDKEKLDAVHGEGYYDENYGREYTYDHLPASRTEVIWYAFLALVFVVIVTLMIMYNI